MTCESLPTHFVLWTGKEEEMAIAERQPHMILRTSFGKNFLGCEVINEFAKRGSLVILESSEGLFTSRFVAKHPDRILECVMEDVYRKLRDAGVRIACIKKVSFGFNSGNNLTQAQLRDDESLIRHEIVAARALELEDFKTFSREGILGGHYMIARSGYRFAGRISGFDYEKVRAARDLVRGIIVACSMHGEDKLNASISDFSVETLQI